MKILVTGASGQLGSDLVPYLRERGHEVLAPGRSALDLTWDTQRIADFVSAASCDWIANCAAMTAVDACESAHSLAMQINRDAAEALGSACAASGARLLQVSTDYVFSGNNNTPYSENDETGPINVYGASKLAGEQAILGVLPSAAIVRTSWVYGVHGRNFVKTILDKALHSDDPLSVVDDQVGVPTWTRDLCVGMTRIVEAEDAGIFHFASHGLCSWYDFAVAIAEDARTAGFGVRHPAVVPISTVLARRLFKTAAARPAYSVLDNDKISKKYFSDSASDALPYWRHSLRSMLTALKSST